MIQTEERVCTECKFRVTYQVTSDEDGPIISEFIMPVEKGQLEDYENVIERCPGCQSVLSEDSTRPLHA